MSNMNDRKEIRAAIIGLGVGEQHIAGFASDGRCDVAVLCDTDVSKLRAVGSRYPACRITTDVCSVFEDPSIDIVSIASYDNYHGRQVVAAIENGKHVFVEKPLCLHRHEVEKIFALLQENPTIRLSSNLILRKVPRFSRLRDAIRNNDLGDIYYVVGEYDYGRLSKLTDGWRGRAEGYSVVHGGAIHLIDLLLWLTGGQVKEVFAYGNNIATIESTFNYIDCVSALLQFEGGVTARIGANFASVTKHHHKVEIYGTKGVFMQGHMGAAYSFSRSEADQLEILDDPYPGVGKGDMIPAFVRSVLNEQEPDVRAQEVLDAMAVSLAIDDSVNCGVQQAVTYYELSVNR